ncbi:MAG: hypothetical protein H0V12_05240 [Chloroflexi bacterium]|nr:hypothetical protein [Chloroflexota bacterium]
MMVPHVPRTAAELATAIEEGVLVEGLGFDAKADLEHGAKGNTSLAIDLAAIAVSGGIIAIGVAEERYGEVRRLVPRPVKIGTYRERVSQVGLSRVDPPIFTTTIELLPEGDGEKGYLLILVPPSPDAPHMVDGKYRGRSDTTNIVLGDADVRRIQSQRRRDHPDIATDLERAVARDPTPQATRKHAHLFVVGRPVVPTGPAMLQERLGHGWQKWFREDLIPLLSLRLYAPDLRNATTLQRRPDGWAATAGYLTPDRQVAQGNIEDSLLELEIDEDGALRLFCGRASDSMMSSNVRWTFEVMLAGLTWGVLRAAAVVAEKTDHFGNWNFGVGLTNARGIASHAANQRARWADPYPYGADEFRATTQATFAELQANRSGVIDRLLGRLNRALNDDSIPLPDFDAR